MCNTNRSQNRKSYRLALGWAVLISGLYLPPHASPLAAENTSMVVSSPAISIQLDERGRVVGAQLGERKLARRLEGQTRLVGCLPEGKSEVKPLPGGGYAVSQTWTKAPGQSCRVTDRFSPTTNSVRWEVEVLGTGAPWSAPIETGLQIAPERVSFWAPWGAPYLKPHPETSIANTLAPAPADAGGRWLDPLVPRPLGNTTLAYGAPNYNYDKPLVAYTPGRGNVFCMPMLSLLWDSDDAGLTFALSPQDTILDLTLTTSSKGALNFQRLNLRISEKSPIRFAADFVAHEADWRGGLRWMTRRYPEYFNPPNPLADELAGTGAYSCAAELDAAKFKKMAFRTIWQASIDFPYMGMFLPPVGEDESWKGLVGGKRTLAGMRNYAKGIREKGFYVLNYFNVSEFGIGVKYPAPAVPPLDEKDLWKDCHALIYGKFADAVLRIHESVNMAQYKRYPKLVRGGPWFSWCNCIAMDCGDPVYQAFLLDQARRHIDQIPDSSGICIDRLDWLRFYNERADDGVSWFEGKPARSLYRSWQYLMEKLGPLMHQSGKVIFVNNHTKRLDILRHVDGIFDEFGYCCPSLNCTALLSIQKPAIGWVDGKHLSPDMDGYFQKHLYLGVYPMAPFPRNDHGLAPSPAVDQYYLDYGPLLDAMRGKKWVLEPHCVEAVGGMAKVNLFQVPVGYVLPVTYGGKAESVEVVVRNVKGLTPKAICTALHPGVEQPAAVPVNEEAGVIRLTVPLQRGCAMVKIAVQ